MASAWRDATEVDAYPPSWPATRIRQCRRSAIGCTDPAYTLTAQSSRTPAQKLRPLPVFTNHRILLKADTRLDFLSG